MAWLERRGRCDGVSIGIVALVSWQLPGFGFEEGDLHCRTTAFKLLFASYIILVTHDLMSCVG